MRIYKKCPCCGKMIFLLLGSEFGNEVEFGSGWAGGHLPTNFGKGYDWECLDIFLKCLRSGQGEIFISLKDKDIDKVPKEFKEMILNWTEKGYQPEEKEKPKEDKKSESKSPLSQIRAELDSGKWDDWKNISLSFVEEQVKGWQEAGFTYNQCKEWIDVGFRVDEYEFCKWLRDVKKMSAEDVLNYGNDEELRREFENTHTNFD